MTESLDSVMTGWTTAWDALSVVRRLFASLEDDTRDELPADLTAGTVFHATDVDEYRGLLGHAEQELNDITIVALVAAFEQCLRDLLERYSITKRGSDADAPVQKLWTDHRSRLRVSTILAELQDLVGDARHTDVKSLVAYRNWVAHGRNADRALKIGSVPHPRLAYDVLRGYLQAARVGG